MGVRYYDPTLGRFTQTDPTAHLLDLSQGNRYSYAGDNPTNYTDPSGKSLLGDIFDGISEAASVVATAADVLGPVGSPVSAIATGISAATGVAGGIANCTQDKDTSCVSAIGAGLGTAALGAIGAAGTRLGGDVNALTFVGDVGSDIVGGVSVANDY